MLKAGATARIMLIAAAATLLSSCSAPSTWQRCKGLVGAWHDETTDTAFHFIEVWTAANDSTITGWGYGLVKSDTAFKEELRLIRRGPQVIYAARVPDQNDGRWVEFTARTSPDERLIFEDPTHDFPQRIEYVRDGAGWHVILSGREKGEALEQHLHYTPYGNAAGS